MSENQLDLKRTAGGKVDEGIHLFKITGFEEKVGNAGPYWQFRCECLTKGQEGRSSLLFISLSQSARWKAEQFLDAVGAPPTGSVPAEKFIGKTFRASVVHEIHEGQARANIKEMFPAGTNPAEAVAAPPKAVKAKKVAAAETDAELPSDTGSDEEIPF